MHFWKVLLAVCDVGFISSGYSALNVAASCCSGTGLEGGTLGPASAVLSLVLDRAFSEQHAYLDGFSDTDLQTLDTISELFRDCKDMCRKVCCSFLGAVW